jgi:hypothetical protein
LLEGWKSDHELEVQFDRNDRALVEKICGLMNLVQAREGKMTNLTGHIYHEIDYMDKYMNKMVKSAERGDKKDKKKKKNGNGDDDDDYEEGVDGGDVQVDVAASAN